MYFLNNLHSHVDEGMETEISTEDFCFREIKLCQDNGVDIDDYIALKEILIWTGIEKGHVNKEKFKSESGFKDTAFVDKIMELHEEYDLVNFKSK